MAFDDSTVSCLNEELYKLKGDNQKLKEEHNILKSKLETLECQVSRTQNRADTDCLENNQTNDYVREDKTEQNETATLGSFYDFVKGLVSQTSLHGLPNITNSTEKWIAVFWMVLMIAGTGMAGWQLVEIFTEYFSYPVFTITRVYNDKIELPEITICNKNGYLRSLAKDHFRYSDELTRLDMFSINEFAVEAREEVRTRLSHNLTDFIQWWSLRKPITHTRQSIPEFGNCYSFVQTIQPNDSSEVFFLYVNLNANEYLLYSEVPEGYIYLREKDVSIIFSDQDVDEVLTPGYNIEIYPELVSDIRLNGNYANCQDDEELFFEETGMKYSQKACRTVCESKRILEKCGCVKRYLYSFPSRYKISKLFANATDCNIYNCKFKNTDIKCDCKQRCHKKEYRISRVLKKKFSVDDVDSMCMEFPQCKRSYNYSAKKEWAMTNAAKIIITYSHPIHTEYRQVPAYPLSQFIPDIGGTLGLYLGVSLLTLAEIPQLLIGTVVFLVKRKLQRQEGV